MGSPLSASLDRVDSQDGSHRTPSAQGPKNDIAASRGPASSSTPARDKGKAIA
ncbi:hypothetical protein Scep_028075 [Stephania cephalantha]|uniref:Uncharacterized protein n=1 Tax=Stephania cephalantha TaxID=152367 RepID=A0AAP0HHT4_9MAGN